MCGALAESIRFYFSAPGAAMDISEETRRNWEAFESICREFNPGSVSEAYIACAEIYLLATLEFQKIFLSQLSTAGVLTMSGKSEGQAHVAQGTSALLK